MPTDTLIICTMEVQPDNTNPDQFISNLSAIATNYGDKPIFQTEYDYGDWFNTAWLMHNCLVHGNVSGYLYWGLIWDAAGGKPLIGLENPWNSGRLDYGRRIYITA